MSRVQKHKYIGSRILGVRYNKHFSQKPYARIRELNSDSDQDKTDKIHHNLGKIKENRGIQGGENSNNTQLLPYKSTNSNINVQENRIVKRAGGELVPSKEKRSRGELAKYFSNFSALSPSYGDIGSSLFTGNYAKAGLQAAHKAGAWAIDKYQNRQLSNQTSQVPSPREAATPSQGGNMAEANEPESMEQGGNAAVSRAGSGPGMGTIGAAGGTAPSVFEPHHSHGTPFRRTYVKTYRFLLPACQSRVFRLQAARDAIFNPSDIRAGQETFIKIGSSAFIPMERLFMYMDPYEYSEIFANMQKFHIRAIGSTIHALGVRAPYTTGSSSIEVANANLQLPIMDLTPLAHHYPVSGGGADQPDIVENVGNNRNILDILRKVVGSATGSDGTAMPGTANTATLNNVSARYETRRWGHRAYISLHEQGPNTSLINANFSTGFHHSWPNIMNYVEKMVNGSNHLGLAFEKEYTVNKTLWERTNSHHVYPTSNNIDTPLTSMNDYALSSTLQNDTIGTSNQVNSNLKNAGYSGNMVDSTGAFVCNQSRVQRGVPPYAEATVICPIEVSSNGPEGQYPFIIAMYNIRNITTDAATDISTGSLNDIVDLNMEFLLEMVLEAEGTNFTPIYYNPTWHPTPKWYKKRRVWTDVNSENIVVGKDRAMWKDGVNLQIERQTIGNYTTTDPLV